ncbi:GNAT family N-acetyltransferase [Gorillibacterium massiliense]|uniref:GNAT family N-acetyltransferase n=1 Tax=Gorillibacterium massiliense TaxID=1280390 RepID=UPI0004B4F027|nr:hypothetical protein [Gorillibacterium massiliense]
MKMTSSPFQICPFYEGETLSFSLVKEEDAEELFECYSDPVTKSHMNNDNCGGVWDTPSIDVVRQAIRAWIKEFEVGFFIRWSVTYKPLNQIIGTIEIAPIPNTTRFLDGFCRMGILRIDLLSSFEKASIFCDIVNVTADHFFHDFDIDHIITKSPEDQYQKTEALISCGYEKWRTTGFFPFADYYIKNKISPLE